MTALVAPAVVAARPPPGSDLPRWLIAVLVSFAAHAALTGAWLAYAWARSQLAESSQLGAQRSQQVIVGELLTRRAETPDVPVAPQGAQPLSTPHAAALPSERGGGGHGGYFARLREHLAAFRRPLQSVSGIAQVRFEVAADGGVAAIVLAESSGSDALDAEALALVARASPVPAPPQGRAMTVLVPVELR